MAEPRPYDLSTRLALAAWTGVLLVVTLSPVNGPADRALDTFWCLACGFRGLADVVLNFAFFVPLGVLAGRLFGPGRAVLLSLIGVGGIEALQLLIPGRHPSLSDIVFGSLGTAAGAGILSPRGFAAAARVGATVAALAWLAPAVLLVPAELPDALWGQWTPVFEGMGRYGGRILEARVAGHAVPSYRFPGSALSEALEARAEIEVTFVAGPSPNQLAPIFSIADRQGMHVLFIGADGDDVFIRWRGLATELGLEQPGSWVPGALASHAPGDTVSLRLIRSKPPWRTYIDGTQVPTTHTALDDGWGFLAASTLSPGSRARLLSGTWSLLLGILIGLPFSTRNRALYLAVPLAALGLALAAPAPHLASGWMGAIVMIVGSQLPSLRSPGRRA